MYQRVVKRALDVALSGLSLIIFSWLFLLLGVAILISDGVPVFYSQYRLGYRGRRFRLYKFRTMVRNADKVGPLYTAPQDKRVTKIGRILRKFSLDELPQLLNIFLGDMSIVGNRPNIYEDYSTLSEVEKQRLEVRPGLTGLAAANGRSLLTADQRINYDLKYVEECSFLLDCKIVLKTVVVVLKHEGINNDLVVANSQKEEIKK